MPKVSKGETQPPWFNLASVTEMESIATWQIITPGSEAQLNGPALATRACASMSKLLKIDMGETSPHRRTIKTYLRKILLHQGLALNIITKNISTGSRWAIFILLCADKYAQLPDGAPDRQHWRLINLFSMNVRALSKQRARRLSPASELRVLWWRRKTKRISKQRKLRLVQS